MNPAEAIAWLSPWEPSLLVPLVILFAAVIYLRGGRHCPQHWYCQLSFYGGLGCFYIVSFTQFDYYAEHEFFIGRLQQGTLQHFAPFLLALARPGAALGAGLPENIRPSITKVLTWKPVAAILRIVNHPLIAVLLFCGLMGFWLIPHIHFLAMIDVRLYRLMNWSMAVSGLIFWNLALNNFMLVPARLSPGSRIAMMFAVIWPQIAIGMSLFAAPRLLYPFYNLCGLAYPGISALADQQLGGTILWVHGAMMSVIGILVILQREWAQRRSL